MKWVFQEKVSFLFDLKYCIGMQFDCIFLDIYSYNETPTENKTKTKYNFSENQYSRWRETNNLFYMALLPY
jgi:hypothetical protein